MASRNSYLQKYMDVLPSQSKGGKDKKKKKKKEKKKVANFVSFVLFCERLKCETRRDFLGMLYLWMATPWPLQKCVILIASLFFSPLISLYGKQGEGKRVRPWDGVDDGQASEGDAMGGIDRNDGEGDEEESAPHVVDFDNLPEDKAAEFAMQLAKQQKGNDGWVTERG